MSKGGGLFSGGDWRTDALGGEVPILSVTLVAAC